MTVKDLYERLNIYFPPALSLDWDRDGLMVCPDPARRVRRVLLTLDVTPAAAERGRGYYAENRVRCLWLDGGEGAAIVEGSQPYELHFSCQDGLIRHLTCSCYCGSGCKHAFAAML